MESKRKGELLVFPAPRPGWANAHAILDAHALEVIRIEGEAWAAVARSLERAAKEGGQDGT